MPESFGPRTEFGRTLHAVKYRAPEERFDDYCVRYARAVSDDERSFRRVLRYVRDQVLLPAGRQQHSMGRPYLTTAYNCFVGGTIPDSYEGIMQALTLGGMTLRTGGGVGWDFSSIRPSGEPIRGLGHGSFASGPVSFMRVWDTNCETILTAGHRRGAMMGVLRVDHPDILQFISAKRATGQLKNFNISVAVTDAFMEALDNDGLYDLQFGGTKHAVVRAQDVWARIMESNWDWAEPGVLFIDRINQRNPLYYCETIAATNPCFAGETLIVTERGAFPISHLSERGKAVRIWDGYRWRIVDNFRETGRNQQMLKVTLQDGSFVRVTPYHTMILESGTRVEARNLQVGQRLALSDVTYDGYNEVQGAYLKGFLTGDGCLRGGGRLQPALYLYAPKYCCRDRLISSASEITSGPVRTNALTDVGFIEQQTEDYERLVMTGLAPLGEQLRDWCSIYKDQLPDEVFRWTRDAKTAFIAGIFDADGNIIDGDKGFGYQLSGVNHRRLLDIQTLLKSVGVHSHLGMMKKRGHAFDLPGRSEGYDTQDCWRLTVGISGSIALAKMVKFERLPSFADRHSRYSVTPRMGRVVAIEEDGVDDSVYCCTVSETHTLALGIGIITGQCAEQPLPPYGACLLGSINIVKLLSPSRAGAASDVTEVEGYGVSVLPFHQRIVDPRASCWDIDWDMLDDVVDVAVRAFDNVPERTVFPLNQQRDEALQKRRMGLGVTGMANAIEIMGHQYGSPAYLDMQESILQRIAERAYRTSIELAKERGAFPLFDADKYLDGWFMRSMPHDIRDGVARHGIRNGLLLSIAPTGTISMAADNVSSGIEPPYAIHGKFDIQMPQGKTTYDTVDHAFAFFGVRCQTAEETSAEQHIDVLCNAQKWVDSSISKTCNVNGQIAGEGQGVTFAAFKDLYLRAWQGGAKGCTTFNTNGKLMGVRHISDDDQRAETAEGAACQLDPVTGLRSCEA